MVDRSDGSQNVVYGQRGRVDFFMRYDSGGKTWSKLRVQVIVHYNCAEI